MPNLFIRYRAVVLVCAAAFALRLTYRLAGGPEEFWSNGYDFYYVVAQNILDGKGATWTQFHLWAVRRPPTYSLLLIPAIIMGHNYLWIVVPQALIGAGTALCAFLIGRELFSPRAGLIAASITAFYPYYLAHDTALQETGLLTFTTALSTWLLLRARTASSPRSWLASGAMLALSVMVRTTVAPFAFGAAAWLWRFGSGAQPLRIRRALTVLACVLLVIGAWVARNVQVLGKPVMNSDTGLIFWVAHNPDTFSGYPANSIDSTTRLAFAKLTAADRKALDNFGDDHLARDDWYMARGRAYLATQSTQDKLHDAARKVLAGFSWTLNPRKPGVTQWVYALTYAPILLLGLAGMAFHWRDWRRHILIYLQFLTFIAISAAIWSHTSHRTPLDVYLIVFTSALIDGAARRWRHLT